jgi:hypothetical protein
MKGNITGEKSGLTYRKNQVKCSPILLENV